MARTLVLTLVLAVAGWSAARADFEVYFLRHGETTWNRAKILQGSVSNTVLKSLVSELAGSDAPDSAKAPLQRNCCVHVVRFADGRFTLKECGRIFYDPAEFEGKPSPR